MKENLEQLNNTIFTENNVPLPVEDDEDIMYYNLNTKFVFQTGNGIPAHTRKFLSYKGTLFLTNYRLIYRPHNPSEFFNSFTIPITKILFSENEYSLDFIVDNNYLATVYLSFSDSDSSVFYNILRDMLENTSCKPSYVEEDVDVEEEPPLYSDIIQ
ncbi:hypothetical protein NBO_23g0004 [Nosema bombycis CQ1]|uniref:Uncharacterized protein n=1 Tax=Nosema bombycis (strain CQ1 / CVCC 102059) TaxID=578461 RepID=R0KUQ3_NOSB1|nr:hypothetical protein NBO_23g0004 [Nosema bombycis CQ1]|eukprot:EOB14596.1 hypothetical protein NBO_23g0004 [Nosema bombycis CQ1]